MPSISKTAFTMPELMEIALLSQCRVPAVAKFIAHGPQACRADTRARIAIGLKVFLDTRGNTTEHRPPEQDHAAAE